MNHASRRRLVLLLILPLLLNFAACDDDPTRPGGGNVDLQDFWPTEDGDVWHYRWVRQARDPQPTYFETREAVPPAPDLDTAYELLRATDAPDLELDVDGFFELRVDGRDTTDSGAEGPLVRERGFVPGPDPNKSDLDAEGRLLESLVQRRPDLFEALARYRPELGDVIDVGSIPMDPLPVRQLLRGPMFLRGGVIARQDSLIGTYGQLGQEPYWKFLGADLEVGATFTQEIAPQLGADVFLHGRVQDRRSVEVAGIRYDGCVEMLYLLDLGVAGVTTETGGLMGYLRYFDVGTVLYAPGLGPVACTERNGLESSLDDPGGWGVSRLDLRPDRVADAPDPALAPTLENLWPNTDGDRWTYRLQSQLGGHGRSQVYADPEDVPDAPPLDDLATWLDQPTSIDDPVEGNAWMRLQFDGLRTTLTGVTRQNLAETFWFSEETIKSARSVEGPDLLLRQVLRARPDLRERAHQLWPERTPRALRQLEPNAPGLAKAPGDANATPLLLFGYVWEKTENHIGTYGDVDQNLAWAFLKGEPVVGHEFSHQLVPALADDVWLHGRVERELEFRVGGEVYPRAVQVLYRVDYGVQTVTDEGGNVLGGVRAYATGRIVYVPGVGPVSVIERGLFPSGGVVGGSLPLNLVEKEGDLMEAVVARPQM